MLTDLTLYLHCVTLLSLQVAKDVCGKPLMDVFTTIFEQGVRPVSENELKAVENVIKELGIDADVATEVLAQV